MSYVTRLGSSEQQDENTQKSVWACHSNEYFIIITQTLKPVYVVTEKTLLLFWV